MSLVIAMRNKSGMPMRDAAVVAALVGTNTWMTDAFRFRAPSADPTNTGDVRARFRREARRRVAVFKRMLRMYIVEHNLLGMGTAGQFHAAGINPEQSYSGFVEYATSVAYITVIQKGDWIRPYVEEAYTTGLIAAWVISRGKGVQQTLTGDSMFTVAVKHEMEGAIDATLQQVARIVLTGMRSNDRPQRIMRSVGNTVDKLTINRVNTICNVTIVQVHNAGRLDYLQALGRTHVGVVPELRKPGEKKERRLRRDSAPCVCTDCTAGGLRYMPKALRDATYSSPVGTSEAGAPVYSELPAWIAARMPKSVATKLNKQLEQSLKNYGAEKSQYEQAQRSNKRFAKSETGMVEVVTAGDDLVCDECSDIAEDGPYSIDRARSLIPAHPNCRCAFVDVPDDEADEDDE